jgi:hypothetical protein
MDQPYWCDEKAINQPAVSFRHATLLAADIVKKDARFAGGGFTPPLYVAADLQIGCLVLPVPR